MEEGVIGLFAYAHPEHGEAGQRQSRTIFSIVDALKVSADNLRPCSRSHGQPGYSWIDVDKSDIQRRLGRSAHRGRPQLSPEDRPVTAGYGLAITSL